jgi:hypothetical protein
MFAAILAFALRVTPDASADLALFNGQNLDDWVAEGVSNYLKDGRKRPVWSIEGGSIVCTGKGFGFLRYDLREFDDFILHVEFRMEKGCNSGIGVRTRPFDPAKSRATRPSLYSYEIQLIDDAGKPPTVHSSGSLYRYIAPAKSAIKPAGQWNSIDVECAGTLIKVTLNGELVVGVDQRQIVSLRRKPQKGYVCLQNHGGNIVFRAVSIREISRAEP